MASTLTDVTSVKAGKHTFAVEGDNNPHSPYYSRVIHYPGKVLSGVTLGRGYDMGKRSKQEIYADLTRAGISQRQAEAIAQTAGLTGAQAQQFVKKHRDEIGEITEQQQIALFNNILPKYILRAKSAYAFHTKDIDPKPQWEELHPAIKDILIDIIYQGFRGETAAVAATKNDIDHFILYIKTNPELLTYEKSRKRINYLDKNRMEK